MIRLALRFVVSVALAAALLAFVVNGMLREHVPDGQPVWPLLLDELGHVPVWALLAYVASFVVVHVARVLRWSRQVEPLGETDRRLLFGVACVGYAAIVLLPLRMGEAVRPWLLARHSTRVTFAAALGTAVAERIIDGLLISALLALTVFTAPQPVSPLVSGAAWASAAVFAGASFGIVLFVAQRALAVRLLHATFGRISAGLAGRIEQMLVAFVDGLATLRRGGTLAEFFALTGLYWTANALGIWLLARAFGLDVPVLASFGLLAVLVVGIMLPAGPGFLGNFQLFLGEGLRLYLPAAAVALPGFALALAMNVVQLVVMVLFAVPFAASLGVSVREVVAAASEPKSTAPPG